MRASGSYEKRIRESVGGGGVSIPARVRADLADSSDLRIGA